MASMLSSGNPPFCLSSFRVLRRMDWRDSSLRSEEHTSELQSLIDLVCRLLLEKQHRTPSRSSMYPRRRARAPSHRATSFRSVNKEHANAMQHHAETMFFFLNDRAPPDISPFPTPVALPF